MKLIVIAAKPYKMACNLLAFSGQCSNVREDCESGQAYSDTGLIIVL